MLRTLIALLLMGVVSLAFLAGQTPQLREITMAELRDKIEGGWAGQMIGVSFGAPTEFRSLGKIIEGDLPAWKPERVSNAINQDDLYVDMTFAQVLDEKGLDATTEDFGAMFRDSRYAVWHANLAARRALLRGVPAAEAGLPKHNAHADDIDFQIEADFIGLMAPGLLRSSNEIAWRAGRVMNYGDGIYGGMFVSCMYAAAFFESDPRKLVEAGLACIPAQSAYGRLIKDVLDWHRQHPGDWRKNWQLIQDKWDKDDLCPAGALLPFNIDAKLNGAYIALGMLYGEGDFGKTIEISTRAGQDSDCNPASAAGVLGVAMGYSRIPNEWKGGIPAIQSEKFRYTDYSFVTIVDSTVRRAVALVEKNGGRREGEKLLVRTQAPQPARLEVWKAGRPVERVDAGDARWEWKGNWTSQESKRRDGQAKVVKTSGEKGAEAVISFNGTGAVISGSYMAAGGTADVYLDGKFHKKVDSYSDGMSDRGNESVWHAFGLKPGRHVVRLVVRGERFADSKGTDISIDDLVVYR